MDAYRVAPQVLARVAALGRQRGTPLAGAGTVLDRARLSGAAFGRSRAAAALPRAYERGSADHVGVLAVAGPTVRGTADAARGAADADAGSAEACADRPGGPDPHRVWARRGRDDRPEGAPTDR